MKADTDVTRRRRILVVDAPLQKAFVVDVAMIPALAMGVTTLIVAAFCHRLNIEAEQQEVELDSLVPLFVSFACFVLASGFAIAYQALRISNKIAGPQLNMRRVVDRVLAGEHGARVRLRDGDFMFTTAEDINRLIEHFAPAPAPDAAAATDVDAIAAASAPANTPAGHATN